jgi:murein DD-endopeptidase MepM/ murein hydrolase activator NlpD
MRRCSLQLALVVGAAAALAYSAYLGGAYAGARHGARAAAMQADLDPWRTSFGAQKRALQHDRVSARRGLEELTRHMAQMQTRIVHLDALAARLIDSTDLHDQGFDFSIDPPLGGPEELPQSDADRAATVVGAAQLLTTQLENQWRQLDVLEDLLVWRRLSDEVRPEGVPVASGYVSSRFGERIDPLTGRLADHKGVDFAAGPGTQIVAVAAGIVIWSGRRDGYGETIDIDHGNERVTRYAHNAENLVAIGDVVTRGQAIARLGDTGRTTGPNLHFEVLQAGKAVDPAAYMK